jgi:hypothetical protein
VRAAPNDPSLVGRHVARRLQIGGAERPQKPLTIATRHRAAPAPSPHLRECRSERHQGDNGEHATANRFITSSITAAATATWYAAAPCRE